MSNELVIFEPKNLPDITKRSVIEKILDNIKLEALRHVPDLSTKKGRDAIISNAAWVASTKVKVLKYGKKTVEDKRNEITLADLELKYFRDCMDYLKAEIRFPVTQWEAENAAEKERQKDLDHFLASYDQAAIENDLFNHDRDRQLMEAADAKLEAERLETERIENLKREAVEAERVKAENAATALAAKVEKDKADALALAEKQKQDAIDEERRKANAEKERLILAEEFKKQALIQEKINAEKKAADLVHRKAVIDKATVDMVLVLESLEQSLEHMARQIIMAISENRVANISIQF